MSFENAFQRNHNAILHDEAKNGIKAVYTWCVILDKNPVLKSKYKSLVRAFMAEFIGVSNFDCDDLVCKNDDVEPKYKTTQRKDNVDLDADTRANLILESFKTIEAETQKEFDDLAEHIRQKRETYKANVEQPPPPGGIHMVEVAPGQTVIKPQPETVNINISNEQVNEIRKLQDKYLPKIKPCELPEIPEECLSDHIKAARNAIPINNLTRLNKRDRDDVIFNLWKRAETNVNSMLDDDAKKDVARVEDLIKREADRLLADYL